MSPEHREMAESLLNSLWDQYLSAVSASRGKSKDDFAKLIDQYLVLPEKYKDAGLIDGVKYLDEILKELKGDAKGGISRGEERGREVRGAV
jgi:ClpP class serine protease